MLKNQPRTAVVEGKKLIDKKLRMSLAKNKTFELWRSFMPERMKIKTEFPMTGYRCGFVNNHCTPRSENQEFDKRAATEVSDLMISLPMWKVSP